MRDLLAAICLLVAIEGLLFAAFPEAMKRAVASLLELPAARLRTGGLVAAIAAVAFLWLVQQW